MTTSNLRSLIVDLGISEQTAMNRLQDVGAISDNCVWIQDIAESDLPAAASELKKAFEL